MLVRGYDKLVVSVILGIGAGRKDMHSSVSWFLLSPLCPAFVSYSVPGWWRRFGGYKTNNYMMRPIMLQHLRPACLPAPLHGM